MIICGRLDVKIQLVTSWRDCILWKIVYTQQWSFTHAHVCVYLHSCVYAWDASAKNKKSETNIDGLLTFFTLGAGFFVVAYSDFTVLRSPTPRCNTSTIRCFLPLLLTVKNNMSNVCALYCNFFVLTSLQMGLWPYWIRFLYSPSVSPIIYSLSSTLLQNCATVP